jgi:hypothetical protein
MEILNRIDPDDGEILYGERNGGIGYCPFRFTEGGVDYVATVRTADRNFVKIHPRMLDTNICAAEERDMEHVLIVGFNWNTDKTWVMIKNCREYIHHATKGLNYQIFRRDHLSNIMNGVTGNVCDVKLL